MIEQDIKLLLHDALADAPEAETADEIMKRASVSEIDVEAHSRRRRPARVLIAMSVATAVAVGLVVVTSSRDRKVVPDETPADQPASTEQSEIAITDPLSIDLDGLVRSTPTADASPAPTRTYLLPDLGSLPPGWSVIDRSGGNDPGTNSSGKMSFQWNVTLRAPNDELVHLFVQDLITIGPVPGDQTVDLPDGTQARLGELGLVWNLATGAQISLQRGSEGDDEQLVELAGHLHYVEVDNLPLDPPSTLDGSTGTSLATFAGRIGGVPWQVRHHQGDLRSASVYAAGRSVYGFENTRSSQPDNSPAWYAALVGVGTPGAVVVGFTPPTVATVSLELRTGEIVSLPVDQRSNETWFAVPIPTGLSPVAFIFRDVQGNTMRVEPIPTIPSDPWGSADLIF